MRYVLLFHFTDGKNEFQRTSVTYKVGRETALKRRQSIFSPCSWPLHYAAFNLTPNCWILHMNPNILPSTQCSQSVCVWGVLLQAMDSYILSRGRKKATSPTRFYTGSSAGQSSHASVLVFYNSSWKPPFNSAITILKARHTSVDHNFTHHPSPGLPSAGIWNIVLFSLWATLLWTFSSLSPVAHVQVSPGNSVRCRIAGP